MSSILKVDQLQDSGGNAIITSNGSGTFTSSLPNTGITMADFWYFNATQSISANTSTTLTNWSRTPLDSTTGTIGLNMSESSGIFTFPQTGIYNISSSIEFLSTSTSGYRYVQGLILTTPDNSTYTTRSIATSSIGTGINSSFANVNVNYIMDVPDTSNYKVKINAQMVLAGEVYRNAGNARTNVIFTRIGDT
jgi:hypothetical protein